MNILREYVSGQKNRYKDGNYNLDLTYITPRIIGMSIPAEGFSSTYRNELTEVSRFLHEHHGDNFLVINLSQKKYNYGKFGGRVKCFHWVDHHSPYLPVIFEACEDINNIVVVHCIAGKGRTGSLCSSYLLYIKAFSKHEKAIRYCTKKRGVGVTHPGQKRYVWYVEELLKSDPENLPFKPCRKELLSIRFCGIPNFNSSGSSKPSLDIYNVRINKKIISEKFDDLTKYKIEEKGENGEDLCDLVFKEKIILNGDIFIKFNHNSLLSSKKMFRTAFNTHLLNGDEFTLTKDMLDPDKTKHKPQFPETFKITLFFKTLEMEENDPESDEQLDGIKRIGKILMKREEEDIKELDTQIFSFGDPDFDDRDEMMVHHPDDSDESDMSSAEECC